MSFTRFTNCHLIDNGELYEFTDLYVNNATKRICHPPANPELVSEVIDLKQQILAPGFIDIQNNGIYGLNFSNLGEESTAEDVAEFKRFYRDAMAKYLSTGLLLRVPLSHQASQKCMPKCCQCTRGVFWQVRQIRLELMLRAIYQCAKERVPPSRNVC